MSRHKIDDAYKVRPFVRTPDQLWAAYMQTRPGSDEARAAMDEIVKHQNKEVPHVGAREKS